MDPVEPPSTKRSLAQDPRSFPVRQSRLKHMSASPAHYLSELLEPRPPSPAMRFGSLVHALLLGSSTPIVVWPKARRGKAWTAFRAAHEGHTIVTTEEHNAASRCAASVRANRDAAVLLQGTREERIEWAIDGRACSGIPDVVSAPHLVEFKVAAKTQPDWLVHHCRRMGYHAQLAWYRHALACRDVRIDRAWIVAVEPRPPCAVTILDATGALAEGDRAWRLWWERLMVHEASGEWPAYAQAPVPFIVEGPLELALDGETITLD